MIPRTGIVTLLGYILYMLRVVEYPLNHIFSTNLTRDVTFTQTYTLFALLYFLLLTRKISVKFINRALSAPTDLHELTEDGERAFSLALDSENPGIIFHGLRHVVRVMLGDDGGRQLELLQDSAVFSCFNHVL